MNNYIIRNPQVSSIISAGSQKDLLERNRLLLKLMTARDTVRVICGPHLFGKTALAIQYAKIVFADQSTIWIKAGDLRFLRDLDAHIVMNSLFSVLEHGPVCELFVFDAVPRLSTKQLREFIVLINSLIMSGCEVIITTRCQNLFSFEELKEPEGKGVSKGAEQSCRALCGGGVTSVSSSSVTGCFPFNDLHRASYEASPFDSLGNRSLFSRKSNNSILLSCSEDNVDPLGHKSNRFRLPRNFPKSAAVIGQTEILEVLGNLDFSYITAKDLLLDSREITRVFPEDSLSLLGWVRPAVLCDKVEGHKRLFVSLQQMDVLSLEDSVLLLALILGRGSQVVFSCFVKRFASLDLTVFSDYYPHAGFRNRGFVALELSAQERFSLLWAHLAKLVELSLYPSEKEYIDALLNELVKTKDYALIQLVMKFCLTEEERNDFYKRYNLTSEIIEQYKEEQARLRDEERVCLQRDQHVHLSQEVPNHLTTLQEDLNLTLQEDSNCRGVVSGEVPIVFRDEAAPAELSVASITGVGELQARREEPLARLAVETMDGRANNISSSDKANNEMSLIDDGNNGINHTNIVNLTAGANLNAVNRDGANLDNANRLEINLFGRFEMKRGNMSVPESGEIRKLAKVMIAILVINSQKDLPRAWVEKAVWPENHSSTVSSNFYNLWSYIKRTLSSNEEERRLLGRTREAISLRELNIKSDVHRVNLLCNEFTTAHEVADCVRILSELERIYQGPLMPGINNAQVEAYRNKFQNKVLDAFVEGSKIIFTQGNPYVALHFAGFAFGQNVTREDVCYTYMSMQDEVGNKAGALNTFYECRGALVEEYGIDASRRLDALYQKIIKEVS